MRRVFSCVLVLVVSMAACQHNTQPVPVTTPVASPSVTETFSGTLTALGTNLHNFQVSQHGEVLVTLTVTTTVPIQADPNADPPVVAKSAMPFTDPLTINVGQPAITTLGVTCSNLKTVVAPAGATPQVTGQALTGTFCVSISDPAGPLTPPQKVTYNPLSQSVNYVVTVAHS